MQYTLLEPIDFSKKDAASDASATNVQLLKDAAYSDAPRGTMSFFRFYRPIVESYVEEFAEENEFFPEARKKDLFWLVMRHAFALLRTYEHKGYGSFRNLLRTLVNYNALQADDRMAYMRDLPPEMADHRETRFVDEAIQYLVIRENPRKFGNPVVRAFLLDPERLCRLPERQIAAAEEILEEFEREVDRAFDRFTRNAERKGDIEALAPVLGEERCAKLVRYGADNVADSLFGCIREDPEWFGLPADSFEDGSVFAAGEANAAQPEG